MRPTEPTRSSRTLIDWALKQGLERVAESQEAATPRHTRLGREASDEIVVTRNGVEAPARCRAEDFKLRHAELPAQRRKLWLLVHELRFHRPIVCGLKARQHAMRQSDAKP